MRTRSNIATALVFIGIGIWFLSIELFPQFKSWAYGSMTWPIPIIGIGLFLALVGLLTWSPGMMVPACIVGGIGGLLYWQNATSNFESWAYAWTFISGFAGVGIILSGLMSRDRKTLAGGFWAIFGSLVAFGIFGSFLGGSELVGRYWPLLLVILGIVLLLQGVFRRR